MFTIISASYEIVKTQRIFQSDINQNANISSEDVNEIVAENLSMLDKARRMTKSLTFSNEKFSVSGLRGPNDEEFLTLGDTRSALDLESAQDLARSVANYYGSADRTQNDLKILDNESKLVDINNFTNKIKQLPFNLTINNKYLYTLSRNISSDASGIFADEFQNFDFIFRQLEIDALTQGVDRFEFNMFGQGLITAQSKMKGHTCVALLDPNLGPPDDEGEVMVMNALIMENLGLDEFKIFAKSIGYIIEKHYVDAKGNKKIVK